MIIIMQVLCTDAKLKTFLLIKLHYFTLKSLLTIISVILLSAGCFGAISVKVCTHQAVLKATLQTANCNLQRMKERIQAAVKSNPATAIATCFPAPLLNSDL